MGRTLLTATLQVYKFEQDWKMFARAPRKVDREAFSELCAFAHFYAAAIAHAASPYGFEMILLTMLVGLARRGETLQVRGILSLAAQSAAEPEGAISFQNNMLLVMTALRQRLAGQNHELYTFARALRREDQKILRALLAVTQTSRASVLYKDDAPSDEMLVTALVRIMRRIRQLEKQYPDCNALADEWDRICGI